MKDRIIIETRMASRHDERAIQKPKLSHTRQQFDIFNALAEWAVSEAGGGDKVFGTKPKVAQYRETDLGEEAKRAVKSNISNYGDIQALLDKILPGWSEMQKQGSKNTISLLKGEIPKDVQDLVRRNSAFKALTGGYGGSGMSKALTARDFGTTSLALMGEGNNSAQKWAGMSQANAAPFMVSAPAQADATFRNNLYKQATEQFGYNVLAAPDPSAAGIFNLQTAMGAMAASWGMSSALNGQKSGNSAQQQQQGFSWGGNGNNMQQGSNAFGAYWGG